MKIVCDACQAKYSISDDKVQGKVFKIRCKKCSNIIVVRGSAGAAEPAPQPTIEKDTRTYDYGYEASGAPAGDEAVWHVVINQDQVGPMTAADVERRFSGGEIDAETYIWREGFADWMPMIQVDQFAAFAASGTQTAAGGGGASAVASMFGGGGLGADDAGTVRSDPGDLFATASSSARHGEDDGGDLFGSKPASSSRNNAGEAAAAKLRGERNENSVLFSLNNLAQLASDRPAPAASTPSSSSAGHATGAAGGEGSGLIDIRSMANAYLGGAGAAGAKPAAAVGSIDDLPVFGGGGFSEPAVIVPTSRAASNSKLMYALIGSVGLLAVAAVILVVVMLKGDKEPAQQVASSVSGSDDKKDEVKPDVPKTDTGSGTAEPGVKTDTGSAADPKADTKTDTKSDVKADTKADTKTDTKSDKKPVTVKRDPKPASATGGFVAKADPKPTRTPTAEKPASDSGGGGGSCDEVSCVLNNYEGACCQKFRKGGSPKPAAAPVQIGEKPRSDMPEALDRTMISEGVGKVKAKVMACGDRSSAKGQVKVSVKVNPDGNVASVQVKTSPDPSLGSCVASAMQRATFKRTATGGSFGYPFVF